MKSVVQGFLSISLLASCAADPGPAGARGQPAFRVRSDFAAALNADQGWAGALNEKVTIPPTSPSAFAWKWSCRPTLRPERRFDFNTGGTEATGSASRRTIFPTLCANSKWVSKVEAGATPEGWSAAHGDATGMTVASVEEEKVLRARAARESLTSLYTPPWDATEFAAEFRLPVGTRTGVGFVFGYVDAKNHWRVFLDPGAGAIRVSRFVNGAETVATEKRTAITLGEWHDIEIQSEGEKVEINYGDDALEFAVELGTAVPPSRFGFHVPASGAVEFRQITVAGEARTPRVSLVTCPAYVNGAETADLLTGSSATFQAGAGISSAERTPSWSGTGSHTSSSGQS
jgi:hypothetical protein